MVRKADNLTTFMSCSRGTSKSRNPQGLFRFVIGLLYLLQLPEVNIVINFLDGIIMNWNSNSQCVG